MKIIMQELPKPQVKIIDDALAAVENVLKSSLLKGDESEQLEWAKFDLKALRALLKYKVVVELTEEQYENFTKDNGVDFPIYLNKKDKL